MKQNKQNMVIAKEKNNEYQKDKWINLNPQKERYRKKEKKKKEYCKKTGIRKKRKQYFKPQSNKSPKRKIYFV